MFRPQFTLFLAFYSHILRVVSIQQLLVDDTTSIEQQSIAIIGAGISGALIAFELQERNRPGARYNVTIFERSSDVGGLVRSLPLPQKPCTAIEAGAAHFYDDDRCVKQAIDDVGLHFIEPDPEDFPRTTGVWDGTKLWESPTCDSKATSWKEVWKYGLSPWKYRRAVKEVLRRWQSFIAKDSWGYIKSELYESGLGDFVAQPAAASSNEKGIASRYSFDYIDPCIRAKFMQEPANVHGFTAMMAGQQRRIGPIRGGNIRLIHRLLTLSDSNLHLNTAVISIGLGQHHRYWVQYQDQSSPNSTKYEEFDKIVLTAPLPSANIDLGSISAFSHTSLPQYSDIHVTHFLTQESLSPLFFNLPNDTVIPDDLRIAGNAYNVHGIHTTSQSTPCSFDVDGCDLWEPGDAPVCEALYRIVSHKALEDYDLVRMIGGRYEDNVSLKDQGIRWVDRQNWTSAIPIYQPTDEFLDNVQIARGLFYVRAGDGIISSMEMSCRVARAVAERVGWWY